MIYSRKDLADYDNLYLAWKRIQTSTEARYKYLCKKSFDAFSWSLETNLKLLSSEIINRVYQPSRTSKFYLPKISGLVRPITVLNIKDQIFYQALVNLICQNQINELQRFRNSEVFGGFNINDISSIFFLSQWKGEYDKYQCKKEQYFNDGYVWLAKFDLASFFDVIDHKILVKIFCKDSLADDLQNEFLAALKKWTQPQAINFFHSQGIPQGSCASAIFADIYLHRLDEKIIKIASINNIKYLRYVDDIFLMGKDQLSTEKVLIQLDIVARELSLIPQSSKILVKKVDNIDDELKGTNSLFEFLEVDNIKKKQKSQKSLKRIFLQSVKVIDNNKIEILDITNVKFCLYRLLPDSEVTACVIHIIKNHFYLTDLCVVYLKQSEISESISVEIVDHIASNPNHDWHTAQLISLYQCIYKSQAERLEEMIAPLIANPEKHWILKIALIEVAQKINHLHVILLDELIKTIQNKDVDKFFPYCISILAVNLEIQVEITLKKIIDCITENNLENIPEEFYIFIGYYAKYNNYDLHEKLTSNIWIKKVLEEHDKSIDGISYGLVNLFHLSSSYIDYVDFRIYFNNDEYARALENMCKARGFFESYPEDFIQIIDVFNQILLAKIYDKDNINIKASELGNMIGKLNKHIPDAYLGFKSCHDLRCKITKIHAYSQSRKLNKGLKNLFSKRDNLKKKLSISYQAILEYISSNH
ncbi:MAG: reverse transcriptase domain-containing protein [Cyanobacteria bacterium J06621_8]